MEVLKPYKLGGRTVMVQGFEPQALDYLQKYGRFKPSQIECGRGADIPRISYSYKGCNRVYYPDIFIPHLNLIIEVKSAYTYKAGFASNEAKRQACRRQGFTFRYLVMKGNGERCYDY
jgi:hypothetical protein